MRQDLNKAKEEVSYQKYPEELIEIRNKLNNDKLVPAPKDQVNFELPEGMKEVVESGIYVVHKLWQHFSELKDALNQKNDSLANRIKLHISQVVSLVFRLCEFKQRNLPIIERCKLINVCILMISAVSKQVASIGIKYVSHYE